MAKLKNSEYELFSKLSEEWWDENGKFKFASKLDPLELGTS